MRPFGYESATVVDDAVAALGEPDVALLAGGTNLVDLMKLGVASPARVVDLTRLPLNEVTRTPDGGLRIGATVRNSDLAADPLVRQQFPVLSQALLAGASGQLRNLATTAGNLLQRTRCMYFMDVTKPCNKRHPGSGCPAREGEHRNLAILGHSPACVATHPSDMAVAMVALDAVVHVTGPGGERSFPVEELHRLPGDQPDRDNTLDPADVITAVEIPALPWAGRSSYRKARDRASYAFALASVAAALDLDNDGRVRDVRLALGAVAHKPWRARTAEDRLRGQQATAENFAAAADAELAAAEPLRDNGFKVPLVHNMIVASLSDLAGAR
jgi:xanthine dehydrogenase YagS FAD-binding subunit